MQYNGPRSAAAFGSQMQVELLDERTVEHLERNIGKVVFVGEESGDVIISVPV